MKRGSVRKKESTLVTVWFPISIGTAIETAVSDQDTDRSKYIRTAVVERLIRDGLIKKRRKGELEAA
jgi:hypothetical protein